MKVRGFNGMETPLVPDVLKKGLRFAEEALQFLIFFEDPVGFVIGESWAPIGDALGRAIPVLLVSLTAKFPQAVRFCESTVYALLNIFLDHEDGYFEFAQRIPPFMA
jgi:hypothetical protein